MITVNNEKAPVPMTILAGWQGAGKTTLLNRILKGSRDLRTSVIINDFGPVNVDADFSTNSDNNLITLANGCACCQIKEDLVNTVEELITDPNGTEFILLEASSLAEPAEFIKNFGQPRFRGRIRFDSMISVIDTEQVFAHPEYMDLFQLKLCQAAYSDIVILNKIDLVKKREIEEVRTWINMNMEHVRIVEATKCDVPLEILMSVGRFDPVRRAMEGARGYQLHKRHPHNHTRTFSTWRYESERPFSLKALERMIRKKLPDTVYRCTGIIYAADAPDRLAVLQVAGRRSEVDLIDAWNGRTPRSEIIAIGERGKINGRRLRENFDACLSSS